MTDEQLEEMIQKFPKFLLNEQGRLFKVKCRNCGAVWAGKVDSKEFTCGVCRRMLDLLIEVLKDRISKNKLSCYAISHRKETVKHVDGEIVNLEKENGITRRV